MSAAPIQINFHDCTINLNDIADVISQDDIRFPTVLHLTDGNKLDLIIPIQEVQHRMKIAEYLKENRTHRLSVGDRVSMTDQDGYYTGTIIALEDINVPIYNTELEDLRYMYPWYVVAWDDGVDTSANEISLKKL